MAFYITLQSGTGVVRLQSGTDKITLQSDPSPPPAIQFNNYQFVRVGDGMSCSEKIR